MSDSEIRHFGQDGKGVRGSAATHPAVGVLSATHALEDGLVEPELQTGLVKHLPLVAVPGDQAVDLHRLGLADTMTSRLSLVENFETIFFLVYIFIFMLFSVGHVPTNQKTK